MKQLILKSEALGLTVLIVISTTEDLLSINDVPQKVKDASPNKKGLAWMGDLGHGLIWVNSDTERAEQQFTAIHESVHVYDYYADEARIKTDRRDEDYCGTNELNANLIAWLSIEVLKLINENSKEPTPYQKTTLGDQIKHEMEFYKLTISDLADALVMSEDDAIKLVNNEITLTDKIAERLSIEFKIPAEMWYKFESGIKENKDEN